MPIYLQIPIYRVQKKFFSVLKRFFPVQIQSDRLV